MSFLFKLFLSSLAGAIPQQGQLTPPCVHTFFRLRRCFRSQFHGSISHIQIEPQQFLGVHGEERSDCCFFQTFRSWCWEWTQRLETNVFQRIRYHQKRLHTKKHVKPWHPSMLRFCWWNAMFFCWVTAAVGREIGDEIHQHGNLNKIHNLLLSALFIGNPIIAILDVFYFGIGDVTTSLQEFFWGNWNKSQYLKPIWIIQVAQLLIFFPANSLKKPEWPTTARTAWLRLKQQLSWLPSVFNLCAVVR